MLSLLRTLKNIHGLRSPYFFLLTFIHLISFASFLPSATSSAATYYIATNGNDVNPGTQSQPWKTIAHVRSIMGSLSPGDQVLFNRGDIWYEQFDLSGVQGTSAARIRFSNYGSGNLPVIDGSSSRTACIAALNTSVSYLTIDGFECRNTTQKGIAFETSGGRMPGIIVQNCNIHNVGAGACNGCGTPYDDGTYSAALYFNDYSQGANGVQFLNNIVNNTGGHNTLRVHYDTGAVVVSGNIVGPGCIHNCIDTKGLVGALIANNITTCPTCSSADAGFYTENTYTAHSSITYANNVAYNIPIGFQADSGGSCSNSPCTINANYYNNTVYHSSNYSFYDGSCSAATLDIRNNIFHGSPLRVSGCAGLTQAYNDCYAGALCSGAGDLGVDPLFVSPSTGDFHLQLASPLINKGVNVGLPYNGSAPDIGAYGYGGAVHATTPASPRLRIR